MKTWLICDIDLIYLCFVLNLAKRKPHVPHVQLMTDSKQQTVMFFLFYRMNIKTHKYVK